MKLAILLSLLASAVCTGSTAAEPVWHESAEPNFPWCEIEYGEVSVHGTVFLGSQKENMNLKVDLKWYNESDLLRQMNSGELSYGIAGGGGSLKGVRDSVISDFILQIGGKKLNVPKRALSGMLNARLDAGIKVRVTSDGYVTVDFHGPEGERSYDCSLLFRDWLFYMRQVRHALDTKIDILK
jgi:hypothetical protein